MKPSPRRLVPLHGTGLAPLAALLPLLLVILLGACSEPSGPSSSTDSASSAKSADAASSTSSEAPASAPAGTPVVLISVDTLRSDRLPMYGYDAIETPALDALRKDSILFEHAFSPIPLTFPSHSTMLTGLLPADHGVRDNAGYTLDAENLPWLPRSLKQAGYATGAAVSAFVLRRSTGMATDFDFYDDHIVQKQWPGSVQRRGDETLAAAQDWLHQVAGEPFFFFFHIYEPHRPHDPPEPFASRYGKTYDAEVAAADQVVGNLLDELKDLGVYDRALILFVSDHGEGLGEHGLDEHGLLLYREQIQVPMLVKLPHSERRDSSVARPVHLVDLAPTVLDLLGIDEPQGLDGVSLLDSSDALAERPVFAETFYPRLEFGWSELTSVILWPYHLIVGPDPELYNLAEDPGETDNVLRQDRRAAARLRDALRTVDFRFEPPSPGDPETRAKLAALGYLGGGAAERDGPLPDPKSKLGALRRMGAAYHLLEQGRFAEAATQYRTIIQDEPQIVNAWQFLGHCLLRQGKTEEALAAYEQASKLSSGAAESGINVAEALIDLGRLDQAEVTAEAALPALPADAHRLLALIALKRGDLDSAERHARNVLSLQDERLVPRIILARIALQRNDPAKALELTGEVLKRAPADLPPHLLRGLHLTRGEALAQEGRSDEAEQNFHQEIQLFPGDLASYTRLALLYALTDRGQAAAQTLQQMLRANPTPAAYAEAAKTLRVFGDRASAERLLQEARRRWPEDARLAGQTE